jgi:hypothetical protein
MVTKKRKCSNLKKITIIATQYAQLDPEWFPRRVVICTRVPSLLIGEMWLKL